MSRLTTRWMYDMAAYVWKVAERKRRMRMAEAETVWLALHTGTVKVGGVPHELAIVDCGELYLPSGRLVAEDPWVGLSNENNYYAIPPGRYPVRATVDKTLRREMYLSLQLDPDMQEVMRAPLVPYKHDGVQYPEPGPGEAYEASVDAGTVCFVDDEAYMRMVQADRAAWFEEVFSDKPGSWSHAMDLDGPLPVGMANVRLPQAADGANIILCHSGWGDGSYPVIGGYSAEGNLIAVHIDLRLHAMLTGTNEAH